MKMKKLLLLLLNALIFSVNSQDLSGISLNDLQKMMGTSSVRGASGISMSKGNLDLKKESEYFRDPTFVTERVIDKAINPKEYILGPGDVIYIYIWGVIENKYDIIINAENKIVIPHIGEFDVQNKSLFTFREDVKKNLEDKYKKVNISISLKEMKTFKTYIYGQVNKPGSYVVNNSTKISDLVDLSDGLNQTAKKIRIEIKNEELGKRYANLNISKNKGAYVNDPYIRVGDIVYVGLKKEFISISGAVSNPGNIDYSIGMSLQDVINVSGGFSRGADSSFINIYRFNGNEDSLKLIKVENFEFDKFEIIEDDRIVVKNIPEYRIHRQINILGEVKYPGNYPVKKDKTTLDEVVSMAGGFTNNAFLKGSRIIRKKQSNLVDKEFDRLKTQPIATLSPDERSYLKTKLTEESGLISVDFSNYDDIKNLVLRDGDKIIIAEKSLSIQVTGAVTQPGLVSYNFDKDYRYYINQAGGFNTRAKKRSVMIIKAGTNTWLRPRDVDRIEAGDAIYVAEKQYVDKILIVKDIFLILGSIAAVIMSGLAISDRI